MAVAARILNVVFLVIVGFIVTGIVLYVLGANESNFVVAFILSVARFFVAPFRLLFELDDNRVQVSLNWGLAAFVYLVVGIFLIRAVERAADRRVGAKDG